MHDLGTRMDELKFEAPLAQLDDGDEWGNCDYISNTNILSDTLKLNMVNPTTGSAKQEKQIQLLTESVRGVKLNCDKSDNSLNGNALLNCASKQDKIVEKCTTTENTENFTETFGGSLEDLVNNFDEKITKCFGNYEANVEELAPVQVRSQEELMNECQMWWTITGNFGNILPIDWSKSYTRRMQLPTLNLIQDRYQQKDLNEKVNDEINDLTSEDEAVAHDLDMHALILNGLNTDQYLPMKSAEEIIKEIDDIMEEAECPIDGTEICETEIIEKAREVLGAPLYAEKLQYLSITQLNELYMEMEVLISELSETLINELALRDELEYEKELKNSFISLLLTVQNKRRQFHVEKKRGKFQGPEPKYLTTVIPYHLENGMPDNESLQVLIKILKAINEDSASVPTLLTDYILKILCPT